MKLTPSKLNTFLLVKIPSAFICGVRVTSITQAGCVVRVKHRWMNQNPFNSMYFAVQAMAAELSTGALVMNEIEKSCGKISMLVTQSKATYSKKATGRITFECLEVEKIKQAIQATMEDGKGKSFWLKSIGIDENGMQVSEMEFEWSVKVKLF